MEDQLSIITECEGIVNEHLKATEELNSSYNIYRLLNVTDKEVPMCRILADLLDPDGSHGEGSKYLKEFFSVVLHQSITDNELLDAKVYREYRITDERRIDIVISYHGGFIPIEVKINAEDQDNQCYDYYSFAKKKDPDTFIVYLTKTGNKPSEKSLKGKSGEKLGDKFVHCISFKNDILCWLERIREVASGSMIPFIEQFTGAVRDFIYTEDEEYMAEITKKILADSNTLRTSLEIAKTVNYAKAELMKELFKEFEKQMETICKEYPLSPETKSKWLHYEAQATEEFYAHNESTYPGLNYEVSSVDLGERYSLWLRIEIDNRLFAALCVFDHGEKADRKEETAKPCNHISDALWNSLRKYVVLPELQTDDSWFIAWRYLPTGSTDSRYAIDSVPDLKKMNEAAINLADVETRRTFVSKCIDIIKDTLLSLIKEP